MQLCSGADTPLKFYVLALLLTRCAGCSLCCRRGCGMSVMEMSHRGKEFTQIINEAEADLRTLLAIPRNYRVLFLQVRHVFRDIT